jgi:sporulation protein YqfC
VEDKINKAKESLADQLDLPRDIMLNIPKISIIGNNEITIENHKGIVFFGDKEVGEEFEILYLGGSTMTISGKFKTINYERGLL